MNVEEAIERRFSCRHFSDRKIPDEEIMKIINAARLAPSAHNRQNWTFMILKDEKKNQLSRIMLSLFDEDYSHFPSFCKTSKVSAKVIENASHAILCLKKKDDMWNTEDLLSIGAAIENMLLEATAQGLAALWIRDTFYTEDKIKKAFNIEEYDLVSVVALGYPAREERQKPKKGINEILINEGSRRISCNKSTFSELNPTTPV